MVEYTRQRIRCAVLVVHDDRVLLVKHVQPGHSEWWVPPGGGVKSDESLYECARREAWEKTGLSVEFGKSAYLRQFLELSMDCHHIEVYIEATAFSGEMTIENIAGKGHDGHMIRDARFMTRERWHY